MEQDRLSESLSSLLRRVWNQGGRLTVRDGDLWVNAPFPLPDDLMNCLRARKAEMIAHLRATEAPRRAIYRFRSSPRDEWRYMIAPSSLAADDARARCKAMIGQVAEFQPYHRALAMIGSRGPHACGGA